MLRALESDMRLYLHLLKMQVRSQVQYKVNLVIDVTTYFLVTALECVVIFLFFGVFPTLLGWHVGEVTLLGAVVSFTFGIAELFGGGIEVFSETIRRGEFDRTLLRPVGTLIQVASSEFRMRRMGRLTQGALLFLVALHLLPTLSWTPLKLVALCFGIFSGSLLFIAVMLLGAALCFWAVDTSELTNIFTYGGREIMSWPLDIYSQALQRFFLFVVPLASGLYMPICYILGRALPLGLPGALVFASPLAAVLFAGGSYLVWQLGIRHYESAGG
jgi:ABC-2 type transport system permease protein